MKLAKVLFDVLKKHSVSKNRFADMVGVNEKQVRKMLDGRSPIPMATLGVMPIEMALDFMDGVVAMRNGGQRPSTMQLAIEQLRRERDLRAVAHAQRELLELATELAGAK